MDPNEVSKTGQERVRGVVSRRSRRWSGVASAWCVLIAGAGPAVAQAPPTFDLRGAVDMALGQHPSGREREARVAAADHGRAVAKTAYLPRLDLVWQENRATRNNVFGMLLPNAVIPGISGPVVDAASPSSVWGSAGGLTMSWEVVDFGRRGAAVAVAEAAIDVANAARELTQLEIAVAAADGFLTALAADQRVRAAQANVTRVEVFRESVATLVDNELRPGVDRARAEAELATARIQLIEAERAAALARVVLAESMGIDGTVQALDAGHLLETSPGRATAPAVVEQHPLARTQQRVADVFRARATLAGKRPLPHLDVQSSVFARGSGADVALVDRDGRGLWPQVSNWGVGPVRQLCADGPVLGASAAKRRGGQRAGRGRSLRTDAPRLAGSGRPCPRPRASGRTDRHQYACSTTGGPGS